MKIKEKIILIGGGGHCRAVIDVLESENKFDIAGIVDNNIKNEVLGYPLLGKDNDLPQLIKKYKNVVVTVGQIESPLIRIKLYDIIKKFDGNLPTIISPYSRVTRSSILQEGTVIMHHVLINSNSKIGINNIINTGSIVEHDSIIGDFSHISTKAVINGGSEIGNHCFIGSGSIINENKTISSNCIIGSGSVVTRNILKPGIYAGVPCKKIS